MKEVEYSHSQKFKNTVEQRIMETDFADQLPRSKSERFEKIYFW